MINIVSLTIITRSLHLTSFNPINSSNYILITKHISFTDADQFCIDTFGTHLASIHNEDESIEANNLCKQYTFFCYIG